MQKIGVIGIRGYDVIYSGFETFIKNLLNKSNKKDFYYYLYSRKTYQKEKITKENFSTILVPNINNKYLETPFYSLIANLISLFIRIDVILYLGFVNSSFIILQKIARRKIIVNADGLDWQRKRWSIFGKLYLKLCEKLTVLFANVIVCDSKTVYQYFSNKYKLKNLVYIPYGTNITIRKTINTLNKYDLISKKYIHFVGRLTPENGVEDLIYAFKQIKTDYKCVIVGDSIYEDKYKKYLIKLAGDDKRIVFTGFLKGIDYEEICSHSLLYVETKSVGGTHPSLLEAIAFGNFIIAKNLNFHRETLGRNALYYNSIKGDKELVEKIKYFLINKKKVLFEHVTEKNSFIKIYTWQKIVKMYEKIF